VSRLEAAPTILTSFSAIFQSGRTMINVEDPTRFPASATYGQSTSTTGLEFLTAGFPYWYKDLALHERLQSFGTAIQIIPLMAPF
jgi:hypothetical protein